MYARWALVCAFMIVLTSLSLHDINTDKSTLNRDYCVEDKLHIATQSFNTWFLSNINYLHGVMIACGIAMDVLVFIVIGLFVHQGQSWRFPVTVLLFYITRMLV